MDDVILAELWENIKLNKDVEANGETHTCVSVCAHLRVVRIGLLVARPLEH